MSSTPIRLTSHYKVISFLNKDDKLMVAYPLGPSETTLAQIKQYLRKEMKSIPNEFDLLYRVNVNHK